MGRLLAVLACLLLPAAAAADEQPADTGAVGASFEGVGAAVVPGFIVHGTGLWVRGDVEAARRLALLEGLGMTMAAVGGGVLAATGGSRRVSIPTIPLLVGGAGLFITTWLADIYGTAGGGRRGAAPRSDLPVDVELGAIGVYDPLFDYGVLTRAAGTIRLGRWRIEPEILLAIGADNQRLRGDVAYRVSGDPRRDGTHLDLAGGVREHRYGDDGFTSYSIEAVAAGRLELASIGRSLDGAFVDMSAGLGLDITDYKLPGADTDASDMLLARFGFGMYLGDDGAPARGEIELYYDHRRDEIVAGFSPGMQASGFGGFFGAELDLDVGDRWGAAARVEWGSAALAGAWVRYRMGGSVRKPNNKGRPR